MKRFFPFLLLFSFSLLLFSSCNSRLSVEKRRYRDGFYVKQNIFHKEKKKEIFTQSPQRNREVIQSDSVSSENTPVFSSGNNREVENIVIKNVKPKITEFILKNDTLPKKEEIRKEKKYNYKKGINVSLLSVLSSLIIFSSIFLLNVQFPITVIMLLVAMTLFIFGIIKMIVFLISLSKGKKIRSNDSNEKNNLQKDIDHINRIPLALLILLGVILIGFFIANTIVYPGFFIGLLFHSALIASLIFLIASIRNYYVSKRKKEDNRKLSPKAILALLLAILSAILFFGDALEIALTAALGGSGTAIILLTALWLLSSIFGYKTSIAAKKQIKEGKHWGKGFVITARIILLTSAIWLALISLFAALTTIH